MANNRVEPGNRLAINNCLILVFQSQHGLARSVLKLSISLQSYPNQVKRHIRAYPIYTFTHMKIMSYIGVIRHWYLTKGSKALIRHPPWVENRYRMYGQTIKYIFQIYFAFIDLFDLMKIIPTVILWKIKLTLNWFRMYFIGKIR